MLFSMDFYLVFRKLMFNPCFVHCTVGPHQFKLSYFELPVISHSNPHFLWICLHLLVIYYWLFQTQLFQILHYFKQIFVLIDLKL